MLLFENKVDKTKSIIIWLECKIGKNKQSPEQKDFERMINQFEDHYYYLVYLGYLIFLHLDILLFCSYYHLYLLYHNKKSMNIIDFYII